MYRIKPHYNLKGINNFLDKGKEFISNGINTAISDVGNFIDSATNKIGEWANNISGATSTQEYNANQAAIQREWEEKMRNSSISSMDNQLKSAGINSAMYWSNGGSGAAVPSGAAASSSANGGSVLASIVGSLAGMSVGLAKNGMKDMAKQTAQKTINITNNYKKYNNINNK